MAGLLELLRGAPELEFEPGSLVVKEDQPLKRIYVLKEGEVEIVKSGTPICRITEPGSCFGEMSMLLGLVPSASVVAVVPSILVAIDDPVAFLNENTGAALEIARILAQRVRWLTVGYADQIDDTEAALWMER